MCNFIFNKPVRLQKHKKYDTQKEHILLMTEYAVDNCGEQAPLGVFQRPSERQITLEATR